MEPTQELPQGDAPPVAVTEAAAVPAAPIVTPEAPPAAEIAPPTKLGEAPQLDATVTASDIASPPALGAVPATETPAPATVVTPSALATALDAPHAAAAETAKSDNVEIIGSAAAPKSSTEFPKASKAAPLISAVALSASGRIRTPTISASARIASPSVSRFGLLAAAVAAAAVIGAAGGAAGYAGMTKWSAPPAPAAKAVAATPQRAEATDEVKALRESVAQVRGSVRALSDSIAALRNNTETAGKGAQAQLAKLNEAVERVERSQTEPSARLAKLSEAVDRLERRTGTANASHVAPPPAPDTTGSLRPPPLPPLGGDPAANRPIIEGWALRSVSQGIAIVQGRMGSYEVEVGDDIRGAGRVQNIRRQQDGRWVVVTSRGVIMPNTPIR
jgi:hypothetical protein